jgi:AGZA family xanthine/uracil permease-like MFS transporter
MTNNTGFFEKFFKLSEHGTNARTEVLAGFTTFMTMAYILIVNPLILADAGMDFGAVFTATALASMVATLIMAFYANLPFVLAPGMGLNAFFAYTVVLTMGYTWQFALTAVFIEGIIFLILTFFNVREAIIDSIPQNIKKAVSVGIGLFIAFIGLYNSGIVVQGQGVPLMLGDFVGNANAQVALAGLVITGVLLALRVKGAILLGIIISTVLALPLGVAQLPTSVFSTPPPMALFAFEFDKILTADMWIVLGTFLFVDMFDTIGTLIGVSTKANMLDENGRLPGVKRALFADAVGTTFGAMVGTSTVTTYVESASGVAEGGRTGMTALVSAGLFFVALFVSPLFIMIPGAATAPALIIVGLFMMSPIKEIDLEDFTEAIPAFLTIIMMPLAYSIAEGIVFGIVSYALIKTLAGKSKDVPIVTYILAVLFILKEIFA